jgi:predicted small secreted protein
MATAWAVGHDGLTNGYLTKGWAWGKIEKLGDNLMAKRILMLVLTMAAILTATVGCRTAHGFGEDMSHAGEKLQDKTDR